MPNITLPDGTKIRFVKETTPGKIAEKIGIGLAKKALAAKVNSQLVDLQYKIKEDAELRILTDKDKESIEVIRHSAAHILADAVQRLFPKAKLGIGPSIETGFYYDFDLKKPFKPGDLKRIEEEMKNIIEQDIPFERIELTPAKAQKMFADEPYKLELLEALESKPLAYKHGTFVDLCSGPHVPSTGKIGAFKLLKTAGAYWKGDSNNKQLTRVYGIAFVNKKELDAYLHMIEEAEKRDHRKIGKEMDLFSFHLEAPGMPFFHANGMIVINEIIKYWREEHDKYGYKEIRTPIILRKRLWEQSGHWDHYAENMYFTKIDDVDYAVKPMNCPSGILVYKNTLHSYRELPLRFAEFGLVHRHELSGVLAGLFRVRTFTQDDSHHYCMPDQVKDEIIRIIELTDLMYKKFGFDFHVELSTMPEKAMGTKEQWEEAETILEEALKDKKVKYKLNPGDGAFYGPKIDFHVKDSLGRTWQCGTIQLDFQMPIKFNVTYEARDNSKKRVTMIHRTVLGSLERFFGILIEHYAGKFPTWLAPEQTRVISVSDKHNKYAEKIFNEIKNSNIRANLDDREETVGSKIRDARNARIPYIIMVGEKEEKAKTISIRTKDNEVKFGQKLTPFIKKVLKEIEERS